MRYHRLRGKQLPRRSLYCCESAPGFRKRVPSSPVENAGSPNRCCCFLRASARLSAEACANRAEARSRQLEAVERDPEIVAYIRQLEAENRCLRGG